MSRTNIRQFLAKDAEEVYSMLQKTPELHVGGLTYSEKAVQSWHVTRAQDVILMAEVHENLVGFIAAKLNDPEHGSAYIDCLVVTPEYRGKGIGQQLLQHCLSLLKARGVFFVNLHVKQDFPRAVSFWEKNGFKGKQPMLWMSRQI